MENKIKICESYGYDAETRELPSTVTRLILPNGKEFTFKYNHVYGGLEIIKVEAIDGDTAIKIKPCTSNQVILI